jgi:hypothetical protein
LDGRGRGAGSDIEERLIVGVFTLLGLASSEAVLGQSSHGDSQTLADTSEVREEIIDREVVKLRCDRGVLQNLTLGVLEEVHEVGIEATLVRGAIVASARVAEASEDVVRG